MMIEISDETARRLDQYAAGYELGSREEALAHMTGNAVYFHALIDAALMYTMEPVHAESGETEHDLVNMRAGWVPPTAYVRRIACEPWGHGCIRYSEVGPPYRPMWVDGELINGSYDVK